MSETVRVKNQKSKIKNQKDEVDKFLQTGKKALEEGIKAAKLGNHVGDISKAIQDIVEGEGYSIVRSLVGHGVGRDLHEEPEVPGYLSGNINKTPVLKEGMVIAVEVIYNMGKNEVVLANNDGWTIKTKDGSFSGVFERTIAITEKGTVILTK
jgi:methionyl aminopeptidase